MANRPISGPSINYNGSLTNRMKLYHTMEPTYSALYRMHPILNNQLATQELNQRGLYPTGNQRADVSGPYPADIQMRRKDTPECRLPAAQACGGAAGRGCCQAYGADGYDRYGAARACNACCPGFKATPMSEIVARPSCSSCAAPPVAARIDDGGLGAMTPYEVQRYEARNGYGCGGCAGGWGTNMSGPPTQPSMCYARDDPNSCAPMRALVDRPCCSRYRGNFRGMPYPYAAYSDDEAIGFTGYAGTYAVPAPAPPLPQMPSALSPSLARQQQQQQQQQQQVPVQPSPRVEPVAPQSPFVRAKDANDVGARKEADAVNVARAAQAEAGARAVAGQATAAAAQKRGEAVQAAAEGRVGAASELQAAADKLVGAARHATQLADKAQRSIAEASKAVANGDAKGVLDAVAASVQAANGAAEAVGSALNGSASGTSEVLCGYRW